MRTITARTSARILVVSIVTVMLIGMLPPVAEVGAESSRETELSFTEASTGLPSRGEYPALAVGHFNNDNFLDVASGMLAWQSSNDGLFAWTNNNGASSWSSASTGLSGEGGYGELFAGDINEDGFDDIVAPHETYWSGENGDGIKIYFSDGASTPSWTQATSPVTTGAYEGVRLADINNDTHLDLIATGYTAGVRVWLGDGGTTWTAASTGLPSSGYYYGLDAGDLNNDGDLDLAIGTSGSGIKVYLGDGGSSWTASSSGLPTSGDYWGINISDLDNDGSMDIAAAAYFGGLKAYTGNGGSGGTLSFSSESSGLTTQNAYCQVAVGDVDQDGNLDIWAGNSYKSGQGTGMKLYLGDGGDGGSLTWTEHTDDVLPSTGSYGGALMADLDNDGDLDLLGSDAGWDSGGTTGVGIRAFKTNLETIIHRPIPNAGPDQTVLVGDTVYLDGSGSSHTGAGSIQLYRWNVTSQPTGSAVQLSDDTSATPNFVPQKIGKYVLSLTVMDDIGRYGSWEDLVNITADPLPNAKPTADAGPDQTVPIHTEVQLDGSDSWDDAEITAWNWNITQQPENSGISLSDETAINPTFTPEYIGLYKFTLTVKDVNNTWSKDDTVKITVNPSGTGPPVPNAGPDATIELGDSYFLDGSGSTDDQEIKEYVWSVDLEPSGSSLMLQDVESQWIEPQVVGDYDFSLLVKDNDNLWSLNPDTVRLTVVPKNEPPVATIQKPEDDDVFLTTDTVEFDGSESMDPEGMDITYNWTSSEDGFLSDEESFSVDDLSVGKHTITLSVADDRHNIGTASIDIEIELDNLPVAKLKTDESMILKGGRINFDASESSDVEGGISSYKFDYGDGTDSGWMGTPKVFKIYGKAGTYTATAMVKDLRDQESLASKAVEIVVGERPTAKLEANGMLVKPGTKVTFDASKSNDADGTIEEYMFVFQDGKDTGWIPASSYSMVLEQPGEYLVTVKVRDNHGFESTNVANAKVVVEKKAQPATSDLGGSVFPIILVIVIIVVIVVAVMVMMKKKGGPKTGKPEEPAGQQPPPPPAYTGYDQAQQQTGYDQGQYQGYDQSGYDQGQHQGYDQSGYDQGQYQGYDQSGYDQGQYQGHDQAGYDQGQYGGYDQGYYQDQQSYQQ
jgi:hypothetical protein